MPIACRGQASKWLQHLDAQAAVAEQPHVDDQRPMPVQHAMGLLQRVCVNKGKAQSQADAKQSYSTSVYQPEDSKFRCGNQPSLEVQLHLRMGPRV
jgi:hypothetical protein